MYSRSGSSARSSWILVCGLVILSCFADRSLGAYVQSKDCFGRLNSTKDASSHPRFSPQGLRASMEDVDGSAVLHLDLAGVYHYRDSDGDLSCDEALRQDVMVGLTLSKLGRLSHYDRRVDDVSCKTRRYAFVDRNITTLSVDFKMDRPHQLSSFDITVELRGADGLSTGCVDAFLTPSIDSRLSAVFCWAPIAIFILAVGAAFWRELSSLLMVSVDDVDSSSGGNGSSIGSTDHGTQYQESGTGIRTNRSHLTRIADCLSYIQFIFFSGALSLLYPGFLPAVVSRSSWSTLMLPDGLIIKDSLYYGIKDGIYEVNGTFGGTAGLELMTQVIGAPVNRKTWTNIISLALLILVLLAIIIHIGLRLTWTRDWFRSTSAWTINGLGAQGRKATAWVVLQVFLSYFLLPLVAWTTYQLDHVNFMPLYYTVIATLVVCLIIAACWWAMAERSPKTMGYLIIDGFQVQESRVSFAQAQDFYAIATFVLIFVRGATVGGLQMVGAVQLLVLVGCEVIQLAFTAWILPGISMFSRNGVLTWSRLFVLLLCSGMLPGTADYPTKSALGYVILVFHAVVLLGVFLIPTLRELVQLASGSVLSYRREKAALPVQNDAESRPQIYGLRQLSRRPNAMTNLSTQAFYHFNMGSSQSSPTAPSRLSTPSPESSMDLRARSPEESRTYFRSPRTQLSYADLGVSNRDWRAVGSSPPESVSSQSDSGDVSPTMQMPSPLNPGVDYSFREADLYYGRPRRVSFGQSSPTESPEVNTRAASFVDKLFGSLRRSS